MGKSRFLEGFSFNLILSPEVSNANASFYTEFPAWFAKELPDVLCVQEVTHTHGHTGWTAFDDGDHALPQRADLLADIRGLLPRHQAFFAASDAGPVRDRNGVDRRQEFGVRQA